MQQLVFGSTTSRDRIHRCLWAALSEVSHPSTPIDCLRHYSYMTIADYEQTSLRDMDYQPRYAATGTGTAIMSNRISYFYDLRGASMTVDTGCSGSLVAVHLACQDLKAGSSSIVSLRAQVNSGLLLISSRLLLQGQASF